MELIPFNDQQLQALVRLKIIGPETPIESNTGHKELTGQILGLFPENVTAQLNEEIDQGESSVTWGKKTMIAGIAVVAAFLLLFFIGSLPEGLPKLTTVEQAEVDRYITQHRKDAIVRYFWEMQKNTDEKVILKCLKHFVAAGADVNGEPSPLYSASSNNNFEAVKFLVSKGANVNVYSRNSEIPFYATPLHHATENPEIVKLFLSKGADVNAKCERGETPLHNAVTAFTFNRDPLHIGIGESWDGKLANRNREVIELLVSNGADINAKNNRGLTPIDIAKQSRFSGEILKYFPNIQ